MTTTEIITALQAAKIDIAAAIIAKGGTVAAGDGFSDFAADIAGISSDATAVQAEILNGKTAYIASGKTTGSMPNNAGNVNAVSYHRDGTSLHIVPAQGYTDGSDDATVITDSDFVNTNIKKDVSLFGLTGTYEGSGGGGVVEKDVNFYDYDGTLVYSYTIAEANALSALPALPDHSGDAIPLTGQEWNYTLAQVNALDMSAAIGANYCTTDNKTHFIVEITEASGGFIIVSPRNQTTANTLTIDYGNGDVYTSTGSLNVEFVNTNELSLGIHDITLWMSSGTSLFYISTGQTYYSSVGKTTQAQRDTLLRAYLCSNCSLHGYSFYYCRSLSVVSVPAASAASGESVASNAVSLKACVIARATTTALGNAQFDSCFNLKVISMPKSITMFGNNFCSSCYSLTDISMPSTTIAQYCYRGFISKEKIDIPGTVTTIYANAFYGLVGAKEYNFTRHTSVPTLSNTSAFTLIGSISKIKVPSSLYDSWIAATNWSTYAANIVAV